MLCSLLMNKMSYLSKTQFVQSFSWPDPNSVSSKESKMTCNTIPLKMHFFKLYYRTKISSTSTL